MLPRKRFEMFLKKITGPYTILPMVLGEIANISIFTNKGNMAL